MVPKCFGAKRIMGSKYFSPRKILGPEKYLVQNKLGPKKIGFKKNFWSERKIGVQKNIILLSPN